MERVRKQVWRKPSDVSNSDSWARPRSKRFSKVWCDAGFKVAFAHHCRQRLAVEVVNKIHPNRFDVLPRRWVVSLRWTKRILLPPAGMQGLEQAHPGHHDGVLTWTAIGLTVPVTTLAKG